MFSSTRRKVAVWTTVLACLFAVAATPAATSASSSDAQVVAAHKCKRGKHALIGGAHKCLARGQFCARSRDREYHRYGFHCHKRDRRGNYHLT